MNKKYTNWRDVNPRSFYFEMENETRIMRQGYDTDRPTDLGFNGRQVSRGLHNHGVKKGIPTILAKGKLIMDGFLAIHFEGGELSYRLTFKGIDNYYEDEKKASDN
ncbi:MAG: hypothetical protein JW754_05010 [Candidatus Aenigmarchaeota archaeon]|nr:hypothetical protein [Candidatus Aenigmarchaeota archaeon]